MRRCIVFGMYIGFFCCLPAHARGILQNRVADGYQKEPNIFVRFTKDIVDINRHLFTFGAVTLGAAFIPIYFVSKKADYSLHKCFYDGQHHKNKYRAPLWICDLASKGVAAPLIVLSSLSVFSKTVEIQATSSIFWKGVISIWAVKDLIKALVKKDCCLRPPCQGFKKKKYYGGFPSGHMAEAAYMALLYGLQFGPRWGVPFGSYAAFVFGISVNCNRHYLSQLIAGTGLGLVYAVAAHLTVNDRLSENFSLQVIPHSGGFRAKLSYSF